MPKPLPASYRKIPWRVDNEFAQQVEDAINAVNRHLPPKERISFNQIIQAAVEEYWPKIKTLASAVAKEEY